MILRNKKNNQQGLGLLDVLIAIVVLSVSAVAFIKLQHGGMKEVENTSIRMEGVRVINNVIEAFKANKSLPKNMVLLNGQKWYHNSKSKDELDYLYAYFKDCSSDNSQIKTAPSSWCNNYDDWRYQELMIRRYLSSDLFTVGNRSGICITRSPSKADEYRFTFVWAKVNESNFENGIQGFSNRDCPDYNEDVTALKSYLETVDVYISIYGLEG